MYPSDNARQLYLLLRTSKELDLVGDVTVTVDNPSELLAWAYVLGDPVVRAWRSASGKRYIQVTTDYNRAPIRGRVAAVLMCETHQEFWGELGGASVREGEQRDLKVKDLSEAWAVMPLTPDA